jgi:hypothetical protein
LARPIYQVKYRVLPENDTFNIIELFYDREKWQTEKKETMFPKSNTYVVKYKTLMEDFGFQEYLIDSAITDKIIIRHTYQREKDSLIVKHTCSYRNLQSAEYQRKYKMLKKEEGLVDFNATYYLDILDEDPMNVKDAIPKLSIYKENTLIKNYNKNPKGYTFKDFFIKKDKSWIATILTNSQDKLLKYDLEGQRFNYFYHDKFLSTKVYTDAQDNILKLKHTQYGKNNQRLYSIQTINNANYFFYNTNTTFSNGNIYIAKFFSIEKEKFELYRIEEYNEAGLLVKETLLGEVAQINKQAGGKDRKTLDFIWEYKAQ